MFRQIVCCIEIGNYSKPKCFIIKNATKLNISIKDIAYLMTSNISYKEEFLNYLKKGKKILKSLN